MNNSNHAYTFTGLNKIATILLKSFFSSNKEQTLMSTPIFKVTQTRVIIQLFYFLNPSEGSSNLPGGSLKTVSLAEAINQLYPHHQVELQIVRQYKPYLNASILAQYLAINASKYGFHRIMNLLLNMVPFMSSSVDSMSTMNSTNIQVPSCITGIKVQLSGLLTSQRNRARKTVYSASVGSFNTGPNHSVDYSYCTSKSRVGAFTVKVWISSIS